MTGQTISHFRVLEKLGAGGMGEVYLAEDTKLDRQVALKVLPPHALASEDDRARFYREARAAAALNHANIGHVYEIDEATLESRETRPFIAMEYVDGESLADRISRGPLPLRDVTSIGSQIASGLAAAHAKDIVHRDVKPSNVMLTKAGEAKILDFGLAKTAASTKLTRMGSTLGTFAYMSPEQARGEEVDARTDVWSLGAVLYEMLTGRAPFPGEYEQAVVYAILNEAPEPPTALRTGVPMELERIVSKCLAKDAGDRYQHVDEMTVDLRAIDLSSGSESTITRVAEAPRRARWTHVLPWSLLAVMTVVAVMLSWRYMQPATPPPVERWNLLLAEETPLALIGSAHAGVGHPALAFSPDGTGLVYAAEHSDGTTQLYWRGISGFETLPLPGTAGAFAPFFSPDGQWVGFNTQGKLKKVSLRGGEAVILSELKNPCGATWAPDDRVFFFDEDCTVLASVSASGGDTRRLAIGGRARWPHILPGGEHVLVTDSFGRFISVVTLQTGEQKQLSIEGVSAGIGNVQYTATGHLVFAMPGRLMAVPFDPDRLEVIGSPVPVIEQVRTEISLGAAQFAVSPSGRLVYVSGSSAAVGRLVWVDRRGEEEPLPIPAAYYGEFQLSPDGHRLAISVLDAKWDVWIYDLERSTPGSPIAARLTVESNNYGPVWTPDGERVVFTSDRNGPWHLYEKKADGTGDAVQLTTSENDHWASSFSPDGRLVLDEYSDTTGSDIWLLSMEGDHGLEPVARSRFTEWGAAFSPDGRFVAYTSDAQGPFEVYVQPYPGGGSRVKVSSDGGAEPTWSPIGDALFFMHNNGRQWMVAPIETDATFNAGTPQVFVDGPYTDVLGRSHDVAQDGRRLLLIRGSDVRTVSHLNVVVNWFAELKRIVPTAE